MSFDMEIFVAIWTKINVARGSSNGKSFPISNIFTFANEFFAISSFAMMEEIASGFRAIHTY